jgi:hypothetical protein
MADRREQGSLFGIPYNFKRPSVGRLLKAYWQPGEGMLVKKPFGIGYTLNLASWRSWVVLLTAGALLWQEGQRGGHDERDDESVEVIVDDD